MREVKSCGFLIVRHDSSPQFLLMRHKDRWDLPKGHVDPGETELQCALRELEEETGIAEDAINIHPEFCFKTNYLVNKKRYGATPVNKSLIVYLGTLLKDVDIQPTEHPDFDWFPWNPPHTIQAKTIDPLLAYAEPFFADAADDKDGIVA